MNCVGDCQYEVTCFLFLFQNFKSAVLLMKEAFFKHGEKEALRSCVKAVGFCATESRGELQDFALNKLKEIEDELIVKLKSAIKEVVVWAQLLFYVFYWCILDKSTSFVVAGW